jgi:hypothetical protein
MDLTEVDFKRWLWALATIGVYVVIMTLVVLYGLTQQRYLTKLDSQKGQNIEIVHEIKWKHDRMPPHNHISLRNLEQADATRERRALLTKRR